MLRILSPASRSPAFVPMRPRVALPPPVFTPSPERTRAVRGHLRTGSAAAVILEPSAICVVSADRARRRRVRRFPISELLAIEEHRTVAGTELTIVGAHTSVTVIDVDIAQAWTFCRQVRHLILGSPRAIES